MEQIYKNLFIYDDTCRVYILGNGPDAVLIDFGDGDVLDHLPEIGVHNLRLFEWRKKPYEHITPHLLRHRASLANTYVLRSPSNKGLLIDFGWTDSGRTSLRPASRGAGVGFVKRASK